jgi:hypothetical protein
MEGEQIGDFLSYWKSEQEHEETMLNVTSLVDLTHAFVLEMVERKAGGVLSFQKGGHIVALIEGDEFGSTVQKHILANPNELYAQVSASESTRVREEL